jgi:predicted nucleotidyltransferase component of viral defense system
MIPRAYISAWQKNAPWQTNAQIEQDLVIERAIVELFSDELICENLAFRGGTALHKIFLKPQVRYSEDIDLVQINQSDIGPVLTQIRKKLGFINKRAQFSAQEFSNKLIFKFHSEFAPVQSLKLKIEINCREHFSVLGWYKVKHKLDNSYFKGEANIISYKLEEMLGTKLRALYQRKKGRDLFDLYYGITNKNLDIDNVIYCYKEYMNFSINRIVTSKEFLLNVEEKMKDSMFIGDIKALIRPDVKYDMDDAYEIVKRQLIEKI